MKCTLLHIFGLENFLTLSHVHTPIPNSQFIDHFCLLIKFEKLSKQFLKLLRGKVRESMIKV